MVKVLHIGVSKNPGGVENLIMNYYRHINRKQFRFDFLDIYGDGIAFDNEIKEFGGEIFSIHNYKKYPLRAAKEMHEILETQNYDIIHIHMQSAANLMPIMVALRHGKEVVIAHSHSSSTPKGILRKFLNKINIRFVRKMSVVKWACGLKAGDWMWGNTFNCDDIIVNAVDAKRYSYSEECRNEMRRICGFTSDDYVIGFVGRFGDEKNTFFIIKVLSELQKYSKRYKLLTVGGNGEFEEFKRKIKDNNLEDSYYSAGIQVETYKWYQAMDAFLLPSFFEGFPMVGLEAQAIGLPCFMSDHISKEIDVSRTVKFLSINGNDEKKWAKTINDYFEKGYDIKIQIPVEYEIEVACKILEEKYLKLLEAV